MNIWKQGDINWWKDRRFRFTTSKFGLLLDNNVNLEDLARDMIYETYESFNRASSHNTHGIVTEPIARARYCQETKNNVVEAGLAVPKWDPRIGNSSDGEVGDGELEIKCPDRMYKKLKDHHDRLKTGWVPPKFYHDHIYETHYAQIQGTLKVKGKSWCDYFVYCTYGNILYLERIYFNEEYWNNLYPKVVDFLDNIFEPMFQDYRNNKKLIL